MKPERVQEPEGKTTTKTSAKKADPKAVGKAKAPSKKDGAGKPAKKK